MNGLVPHIAKRPRTVIQQILEHGFVTTEELKKLGTSMLHALPEMFEN